MAQLKPFGSFATNMDSVDQLQVLDKNHRTRLISSLYREATRRDRMGRLVQHHREQAPECRESIDSLVGACVPAIHALSRLIQLRETVRPELLEALDIDVIYDHLLAAGSLMAEDICMAAAMINPRLRTPREQALAETLHSVDSYPDLDDKCHIPYPLSARSSAIDHCLIARAEDLLIGCEVNSGQQLTQEGHHIIISKLFEYAFGEHRNPENIRGALRGRKKRGTTQLPDPSLYENTVF